MASPVSSKRPHNPSGNTPGKPPRKCLFPGSKSPKKAVSSIPLEWNMVIRNDDVWRTFCCERPFCFTVFVDTWEILVEEGGECTGGIHQYTSLP